MPYVEGDRSDCQSSTTTIALSLRLRAIESNLSPSTQGMIFILLPTPWYYMYDQNFGGEGRVVDEGVNTGVVGVIKESLLKLLKMEGG